MPGTKAQADSHGQKDRITCSKGFLPTRTTSFSYHLQRSTGRAAATETEGFKVCQDDIF